MEQLALVCIDNIECVAGDEPWEMAIFNLYNRIPESGKTRLLITGDRPPRQLESWSAGPRLTAGLGADL